MLRVLAFLLALPALRADTACPAGFTTVNGYCFQIFSEMYNHDQAESWCSDPTGLGDFKSALATVNDPQLNAAIVNASWRYGVDSVLLGYKCNSTTRCLGDDGSVIDPAQYFYGGMANPTVGQCVAMDTTGTLSGKWISVDCNQRSAFVCGKAVVAVVDPRVNQTVSAMQKSKCGVPYKLYAPVNISSMNYPANYDNDENCAYFIYGGPFTIYFDYISTEYKADYISVYSSAENFGPQTLVGQYSGTPTPFYASMSRSSLITFVSNGAVTSTGFFARIVKANG